MTVEQALKFLATLTGPHAELWCWQEGQWVYRVRVERL